MLPSQQQVRAVNGLHHAAGVDVRSLRGNICQGVGERRGSQRRYMMKLACSNELRRLAWQHAGVWLVRPAWLWSLTPGYDADGLTLKQMDVDVELFLWDPRVEESTPLADHLELIMVRVVYK